MIETTASKLSSQNYILRSVKNLVPINVKRMLYTSNFNSHITYGLSAWGSLLSNPDSELLFKIQKKAVRHIANVQYNAPTDHLFKSLNILKFEELIQLELLKFMYRFNKNSIPEPLKHIFQTGSSFHNYNTRNKNSACVQPHKTAIFNNSFLGKGPTSWLNLCNEMKNCASLKSFTSKYKRQIFNS